MTGPVLIGEKLNANGSRRTRELLLREDFDALAVVGAEQEAAGAQYLDLCMNLEGRSEIDDLQRLIPLLTERTNIPLAIDSTEPATIEATLPQCPRGSIVNSISLEDGGENANRILAIAKRHDAKVVALTKIYHSGQVR